MSRADLSEIEQSSIVEQPCLLHYRVGPTQFEGNAVAGLDRRNFLRAAGCSNPHPVLRTMQRPPTLLRKPLRKRQDRLTYFGVRHEEVATFMARGLAKHSGQLGVCIWAIGPDAVHLLNAFTTPHGRRIGPGRYRNDLSRSDRNAPSAGLRHHEIDTGCGPLQRGGLRTAVRRFGRRRGLPRRAGRNGVAHLTVAKDTSSSSSSRRPRIPLAFTDGGGRPRRASCR